MSCPFAKTSVDDTVESTEEEERMNYSDYLKLDDLLSCQVPQSEVRTGRRAPDELLFIVTHQAYELWFKEVLFEIDSIRDIFLSKTEVNEEKTLHIISLLKRIVAIFKLLKDQFQCLETMTPFGFMEFRDYISPASGFQSAQFRLLENKLGVSRGLTRKISVSDGKNANLKVTDAIKKGKERDEVQASEGILSLQQVVQRWLSRTPGLEEDGFNFWGKFKSRVNAWLRNLKEDADAQTDEAIQAEMMRNYKCTMDTFESIFDEGRYSQLLTRGERRFSHKALQGALMIYFYRDEPRFHQPYQILQLLIDIDNLITKWRYNHLMLVQRTIGAKTGTGGSSGYHYLRTTISDRYKVFIDLLQLSNYLVPLECIPPLTRGMKTVLRQVNKSYSESDSAAWSGTSDEDEPRDAAKCQ
ncbi:tryptophan 2,3-dioxygenase [Exaiptasia diaphana]|uniref:Tryptophan 2,3-dioxygenase n=1 Tax=Exaiptasia diaphana TaxID=2652724 RepID=A0A913XYE7_EXADI|nr:tryptophan 2,3-dioxygenase [Exaiptasia diaphana]